MARFVWLGVLMLPLTALAKRTPAPVIEPVVHGGVRYTVPNDKGTVAYVVAWDVTTGERLWKKTVFRKCICPFFEHDVQWVFVKQMRLDGERLILVSERGKVYALDLKTLSVKKLKQRTQGRPSRPDETKHASALLPQSGHPWNLTWPDVLVEHGGFSNAERLKDVTGLPSRAL